MATNKEYVTIITITKNGQTIFGADIGKKSCTTKEEANSYCASRFAYFKDYGCIAMSATIFLPNGVDEDYVDEVQEIKNDFYFKAYSKWQTGYRAHATLMRSDEDKKKMYIDIEVGDIMLEMFHDIKNTS